jgi:hypothetical protein
MFGGKSEKIVFCFVLMCLIGTAYGSEPDPDSSLSELDLVSRGSNLDPVTAGSYLDPFARNDSKVTKKRRRKF